MAYRKTDGRTYVRMYKCHHIRIKYKITKSSSYDLPATVTHVTSVPRQHLLRGDVALRVEAQGQSLVVVLQATGNGEAGRDGSYGRQPMATKPVRAKGEEVLGTLYLRRVSGQHHEGQVFLRDTVAIVDYLDPIEPVVKLKAQNGKLAESVHFKENKHCKNDETQEREYK